MKKGQVTIYVIIGLIVLITTVTAFFARDYVVKTILKIGVEETIIVPEKIKPINSFVSSCLKETTEKAIELAGQQGGFINIPRDPYSSEQLNLVSNSLTIFGNTNVAYWFYEQSNGIQKTQIPSINIIENEISNYIEDKIVDCVNNFKDFPEYNIKQGDLKASTAINKNIIKTSINFPLDIKIKDFSFSINQFSQEIKSPLYELYNSAKDIFDNLYSNNILEYKTITMLIAYEDIPYSGSDNECVPRVWTIENTEKKLKEILANNIQALKVKGTNFVLANNENEYFVLDSGVNDKNLDVNFLYSENWPLKIDINPREGSLLKSQSVTEKLGPLRGLAESFVCANTWHFIYDINYPVLVILNKDGYTFQFGTQVVIDNNEPRKQTIFANSFEGFDRRICNNRNKKLTVFTRDVNNRPLEDVELNYKCINSLCDIGKTELNNFNDAVSAEKYPQCLNGVLIGTKEGYHQSKQIISTLEESTTSLFLEQYKELDVNVLIERAGSGKLDEKNEQVYIQLNEEEKEHYQTILYPDIKKIKLIPGNYKSVIYMISNYPEGLNIKEQEIENCFNVPKKGIVSALTKETEKKCIKTIIPATTVDKIISGYSEFEFTITESDLLSKKILFHVPYLGKPTTMSQLSKVFNSQNVQKPEFR